MAVRSLASSNTFGRASSSFASGPWIPSYTQLQAAALSSSTTLPETPTSPSSAAPSLKEPSKPNSRYLFSDTELETLTRNAEEILQLHEHFVSELELLLGPLGFVMEMDENDLGHDHLENLREAIRAVSTKFAIEVCLRKKLFPGLTRLIITCRLRVSMLIKRFVLAMLKPWTPSGEPISSIQWNLMRLKLAAIQWSRRCWVQVAHPIAPGARAGHPHWPAQSI